jgi:uncharacterized RmlC-like cupin family protein
MSGSFQSQHTAPAFRQWILDKMAPMEGFMRSDAAPACRRIERTAQYHGKQGLDYFAGVSAETAGSQKLCLHIVTIPPLARAGPHLHEHHESAVYVLSGEAGMWYGEDLREHFWLHAGDFLYIPANMPHLPYNPSDSVPCVGLIARTDPNEQESVTMLALADPGIAPR